MRILGTTILLVAVCLLLQIQNISAQTADTLLLRAKASIEKREFDSAIADLTQSIKLNPKNGDAYAQRARAYFLSQKEDSALADAEKAIAFNPKDANALNVRGLVKRNRNDLDGAVADYTAAVTNDPRIAKAFFNRGEIYRQQKKTDLALADYNKTIELEPKFTNAYARRAAVNAARVKDNGKTAMADVAKAIELDPQYSDAYVLRAQIRYKLEVDYKSALADLNEALRLNPNDGYAFAERGLVNFMLDNNAQAESDLNAAIELKYESADVYNVRAQLYEKRELIESAKADYQEALRLDPNHTPAKKNLAALTEKYPSCPNITPAGADSASPGTATWFTASVSGGEANATWTYKRYVSAGKIRQGQGTPSITVDTTGIKAGATVTATIDVGGLPQGCSYSQSFTTSVK